MSTGLSPVVTALGELAGSELAALIEAVEKGCWQGTPLCCSVHGS